MSKINYNLTEIRGIAFDVDGVLSPSTIPMGADGMPRRMVNIKDGYALQLAIKHGYKIAIITGAADPAIGIRYRALGITDIFLKCSHKLDVFKQWMIDNGLLQEHVAYVGDDIPDYECMLWAGLPVAPADAAVEIKEAAAYITPMQGGYGVARDLIEEVMKAQSKWNMDKKAFGW